MDSRRAILIGAGATRACYPNAPLDIDFFKMLNIIDPLLYRRAYEELSRKFPEYNESGLLGFGLEKVMMDANELYESEYYGFNDAIRKGLHKLLMQPLSLVEPDKPKTLYDKILFHSGLAPNDFFVSLNYDTLLDNAIINQNYYYSGKRQIDYGFTYHPHESIGEVRVTSNAAHTLFKPHGSLNWLRLKGDKICVSRHPHEISVIDHALIIPPGQKNTQVVKGVWHEMEGRFADATELVIVGCSLSPHDVELRDILKKYFGHINDKSVKIIYRGGEEQEKNYIDIFGKKVKFFQNGFCNDGIEFMFKKSE